MARTKTKTKTITNRVAIPDVQVRRPGYGFMGDNGDGRVEVYEALSPTGVDTDGFVEIDGDNLPLTFSADQALQLAELIRRVASGESLEGE